MGDISKLELIKNTERPMSITFVQDSSEEVTLFGKTVGLPILEVKFENVIPKIVGDIENLKDGDEITVGWQPKENFKCVFEYKLDRIPQ